MTLPTTATDPARASNAAQGSVPLWKTISPLRGIAMCLVIANHAIQAASAAYASTHATLSPYDAPAVFAPVWLVRGVTPVCLVLFMFASGFMAFRFFTSAQSAWSGAGQLLRKYVFWSLVFYAVQGLQHRSHDLRALLPGLVRGDVEPAYWFLTALLMLYVAAPACIALVKTRPRLAFGLALALQLASWLKFYLYEQGNVVLSMAEALLVRPYRFLPAFMLGMLASHEAARLASWLHTWRRSLIVFTGFALLGSFAEAFLLGARAGFKVGAMTAMYATERVSLIVLAFACTGVLLGTDFGRSRVSRFLTDLGNASLGVMLLMDVSIAAAVTCVWQVPRFVWPAAASAYAQHQLPSVLIEGAAWLAPIFFVAGLGGPLVIMELGRRLLGQRVRLLW